MVESWEIRKKDNSYSIKYTNTKVKFGVMRDEYTKYIGQFGTKEEARKEMLRLAELET